MNLPQRKSIRLAGYDYSHAGYYFITLCVKEKICMFGEIVDGIMIPNRLGQSTEKNISAIPHHVKEAEVIKFTVMPNHVHMILSVKPDVPVMKSSSEYQEWNPPLPLYNKSKQLVPKTIQLLKAFVSRDSHMDSLWQSRYYDHIIRNDDDYQRIWQYIDTNPIKWELDRFYRPLLP